MSAEILIWESKHENIGPKISQKTHWTLLLRKKNPWKTELENEESTESTDRMKVCSCALLMTCREAVSLQPVFNTENTTLNTCVAICKNLVV